MKAKVMLAILILVSDAILSQNSSMEFGFLGQKDNVDSLHDNQSINKSLSFGGSWRFQYESFINENFNNHQDQDNLWFLNRVLLHAHLKVKNKFQFYIELNNSVVHNKDNKSSIDQDELAFNQLFVSYKISPKWSVDIGRQNLKLGSGRLVDVREGPNVRRSFDLTQIRYNGNKFSSKAFFAIPVKPKPYFFDNQFLAFDEAFSAFYTTTTCNQSNFLDAYIFYQKDDNVTYNNAQGNERRTSLGLRYFGNYGSFNFNNEVVYQFGIIENQDIQAWTLSLQLENRIKWGKQLYNIGIKSEVISGDKNQNDVMLNTFDALYPRGAYFGRVARFGPSNLIDLHPYINTNFENLFIEIDYDVFWRYSVNDGVYNAALLLEYPNTNNEKFIGRQIGAVVGYEINKHINLEFEGNIIFPGEFLKQSNQRDTLYHLVFTTEIRL